MGRTPNTVICPSPARRTRWLASLMLVGVASWPVSGASAQEWGEYGDEYDEYGYEYGYDDVGYPELSTRVWLDRGDDPVLERGERVRLYYRTSEDAFVSIFHIDTNGTTRLVFPRSPDEDNYVRGGRDFRLVFPGSSSWVVSDDPGVGYFFVIASPEPLDFGDFGYSHYAGGWDLSRVGRRVYRDPYVAMDEFVERMIPDWEYVPYALDFGAYHVEERYDYPRFLCYDCHGFRPYASWNPYMASCTSFRVVVYDDPYFYPATRYVGTRVVFARPVRPGLPRFDFKERARGEAPSPLVIRRAPGVSSGRPSTAQPPGRSVVPARRSPASVRTPAGRVVSPNRVAPTGARTTRPTLERRPSSAVRGAPGASVRPPTRSSGGGSGAAVRPPTRSGSGGGTARSTPTRSSGPATRPPTRSSGGGSGAVTRPPTRSSGGGTARSTPTRSSGPATRPPTRSSGGGTARSTPARSSGATTRPPTRSSGAATRAPTRSSSGSSGAARRAPTRSSGGGSGAAARPPARSSGAGAARTTPTRSSGAATRPPTRSSGAATRAPTRSSSGAARRAPTRSSGPATRPPTRSGSGSSGAARRPPPRTGGGGGTPLTD